MNLTRRALMGATLISAAGATLVAPAFAQGAMRPFEHDLGTTDIPVDPKRIVALHDISQTLPLIEFGKPPVGSGGRTDAEGKPYLLAGYSLTGVDFKNSDIVFVDREDFEAIAALSPDLIMTNNDSTLGQLSLIAPTIVLNRDTNPGLAQLRKVADAAGVLDRYDALEVRFKWQVERLRAQLPDAASITVSLVTPEGETLSAHKHATRGSIGYLLAQLGFAEPAVVQHIDRGDAKISAELVTQLDGDFIIGSMGSDQPTPADVHEAMETMAPGWTNFLHAPQHNQFIVISRDEALALSFSAFDLMEAIIQSNIAGRSFVPLAA
ncbi:MAG: ABC transporter substrate-binding protein [Devosia sp.]|jgi:iron complex transport system substrate-binding protein